MTAWCIGCGEIWIRPPSPCSNSRIIPTAPETASAQSARVAADVKLRGANRAKLAKRRVNQKTRSATNAYSCNVPQWHRPQPQLGNFWELCLPRATSDLSPGLSCASPKTASLGFPTMNKIALVIFASVALMSVGACAGVGKGKGKAPPPYASPVITKG